MKLRAVTVNSVKLVDSILGSLTEIVEMALHKLTEQVAKEITNDDLENASALIHLALIMHVNSPDSLLPKYKIINPELAEIVEKIITPLLPTKLVDLYRQKQTSDYMELVETWHKKVNISELVEFETTK